MAMRMAGRSVIRVRTKTIVQGVESEGCSRAFRSGSSGAEAVEAECAATSRATMRSSRKRSGESSPARSRLSASCMRCACRLRSPPRRPGRKRPGPHPRMWLPGIAVRRPRPGPAIAAGPARSVPGGPAWGAGGRRRSVCPAAIRPIHRVVFDLSWLPSASFPDPSSAQSRRCS